MDFFIPLLKEVFYLGAMGCVIAALLLALKKIFRKALSPKYQYYLWVVLILRLLLPFQPPSALSIYNVFYAAAASVNLPVASITAPVQTPPQTEYEGENSGGIQEPGGPAVDPVLDNGAVGGPVRNNDIDQTGADPRIVIAVYVWLTGMAALGAYTLIINAAFAADVRRRYAPLQNTRLSGILDSCKTLLHIRRPIPLLTSDKARAPSLYGLIRPKILISEAALERLGDDEIRYIFLHELSHFKRKDVAVFWLLTVLQIIYFWNPLIWYSFHKIREDCEIACDAAALKYLKPEEHKAYGSTIIKCIRLFSETGLIPATAGISKNKSSVKRRIQMIGSFKKSKWTGALLAVIIIVALAVAGLTGCSTTSNTPPASPSGSPADGTPSPDASAEPSDSAPETSAPVETPSGSPTPSESPEPTDSDVPTAMPQPSEMPQPSAMPQPSGNPSTPAPAPTAAPDTAYFGQWTVSKVLAYGQAGTYSKEDAEKLIGVSLSFSKDEASIITDQPSDQAVVIKKPVYQESVISKDDFLMYFRMSFDKLGLSGDSVTEINVSGSDAGGCVLLLKDSNTIILAAGGTYFQLARA